MKYIWGLILAGSFLFSNAQQVQYKCYLKTDCSDSLIPYKYFCLIKSIDSAYYPDKNFICTLPDTGIYSFSPLEFNDQVDIFYFLLYKKIDFNKPVVLIDTVESVDLGRFSTKFDSTKFDPWLFCGKLADGNILDKTMNGWREGVFKKGRPVSPIKFYKTNGELEKIFYFNEQGEYTSDENCQ